MIHYRPGHRFVPGPREQQAEARRLDAAIEANLEMLGYAINGRVPIR